MCYGEGMQRPFLKITPERRMTMTLALRQAVEMLQMSQMELSQWLHQEIEKNPLLELGRKSQKKSFVEEIIAPPNLHEHILAQIREHFSCPREREVAEQFLQCLDEKGFISAPEKPSDSFVELAPRVLSVLQTFDPPGIFARSLQETLLLQLKIKGKEGTDAYRVIEECFDDLLHSRYKTIQKKLKITALAPAIRELGLLPLRPSAAFHHEPTGIIQPDLLIARVDGGWTLELLEEELPQFHIRSEYLNLELESPEEKEALRGFKTQAKWIFRSLDRRRKMLKTVGRMLLCKQAAYLSQKGPLVPLTIKELSEKLEVHESTLSRALSGKYASTPRGIIPLRSLVTAAPQTESAREVLEKLVQFEDKKNPLTDDQLAQALKEQGFAVARRTIAKYRTQLKIGTAAKRKHLL